MSKQNTIYIYKGRKVACYKIDLIDREEEGLMGNLIFQDCENGEFIVLSSGEAERELVEVKEI